MPRRPPGISRQDIQLDNFCKVMNMKKRECLEMRSMIRKVALNHFDLKRPMHKQSNKNWKAFEGEMCELLPHIMEPDSESERLKYIWAYTWRFVRDRISQCARETNKGTGSVPPDVIRSTIPASAGQRNSVRKHRPSIPSPSSSTIDIAAVLGFLKMCQPVMTHLLPTFLDIGLRNGKTLEDIASLPHDNLWNTIFHFQSEGLLTDYESDAVYKGIIALGSETS